jgi:cytochrome c-type biogenesis protein CcmH/NrfG
LATVYGRGEALLGLPRGAEAAADFRKILPNSGVLVSDPVGALARLQLARAYAMHGDKARAKAAYRDLGDLWKSADPDVPAVRQAMAESVQPH